MLLIPRDGTIIFGDLIADRSAAAPYKSGPSKAWLEDQKTESASGDAHKPMLSVFVLYGATIIKRIYHCQMCAAASNAVHARITTTKPISTNPVFSAMAHPTSLPTRDTCW
jgi:hypothetical protein